MASTQMHVDGICHHQVAIYFLGQHEVTNCLNMSQLKVSNLFSGRPAVLCGEFTDRVIRVWPQVPAWRISSAFVFEPTQTVY